MRVNGLLVMGLLVAGGFGIGAAYYSYKEPRVRRDLQARLDEAPSHPEGRLEQWMKFGAPQVHHRLSVVARVSADRPWLVTHTVEVEGGGPPEVFGLDVGDLPRDLIAREGMVVVLALPGAGLLGRAELSGDNARHVPAYAGALPPAAADARLSELVRWFLQDLIGALAADIEGAGFEVRIGAPTGLAAPTGGSGPLGD
jgi:hypothetical protein